MNYESDTSTWNYTTGISVGILNVYGTGSDGGSIYFDYACHDSSMLSPPSDIVSWIDLYFGFGVGMSGIGLMVFAPTWLVLLIRKKGIHEDVIERALWAFILFVVGFGLLVSWLWS